MTSTSQSFYVVCNKAEQTYLTPIGNWQQDFSRAFRFTSLDTAKEACKRKRQPGQELTVLVCQASIEMEEV